MKVSYMDFTQKNRKKSYMRIQIDCDINLFILYIIYS
jgi:hypothetical protein